MTWPWPGVSPGEYAAITCDKPWTFKVWSDKGRGRSAERHYRTMTDADIAGLPIADLCARDTFLFMWTSGTMINRSMKILEAWGFTYSSFAFVWVKTNPKNSRLFFDKRSFHKGMGYTTRKNVEVCLLGRRGSPKRQSKNVDELIIAPRREHSRKPDEIYERVEAFAKGPYCELFSRSGPRPNWQVYGDEIGKFEVAA